MPASMTASSAMMTVRVRRAWTTAGSRKALTPLLTASTPVMAVQPLAKDRISSHQAGHRLAAGMRPGLPRRAPAAPREDRLDRADGDHAPGARR